MSREVDERVVSMQFDNRNFERNVSTTMSTLEKLKQGLNLTGATKGLENVETASRRINMSGLTNAVETVGVKFNWMWTVADQTLRNITNSVEATAKRMISALTIDPIKTGFSEYETKMGAIQTIMSNTASKGTTMQDVTRVINELNTYADKTIYNFAEMTRNIGTFTAAGVGLEESASAIQGIANLAAASGSSSQQASTAMYQLSQALASGTVKLMDWNSVVNAGMGGQKFQDALKATAKDHGVAVDSMIKKAGSFRESLQSGWITADILNETLSKFTVEGAKSYAKSMMESGKWTQKQADALIEEAENMEEAATKVKTFTQLWDTLKESAQSGWAQTWEIVVGDFEEAKETLSEISDVVGGMIGKTADSRNELLTGALSTGWKQLLGQGIDDAAGFEEMVTNVAKEHGVKLDEMIDDEHTFQDTLKEGWLTGDMLTESVTKFTDKLSGMSEKELEAAGYTQETVDKMKALSEQVKNGEISMDEFAKKMTRPSGRELIIESLWNAFNGILSVIKPVKEAFREIFPKLEAERLYTLIENFKSFTERLTLSEKASGNLKRTFKGLFAVVDIVRQVFVAMFDVISPLFGKVDDLGGGVLKTTAKWGDWLVALNESIKKTGVFKKAVDWIHESFAKIQDAFGRVVEALKPAIDGIKEFGSSVADAFSSISVKASARLEPLAAIGEFIKNVFVALGKAISKTFPYLASAAKGIGNILSDFMGKITSAIQNADYNALFDIVNGGIISAIGVFIAKFIKSGSDLLDNTGGFIENMKGILKGAREAFGAFTESLKADALKKIAISIGILTASLLVLSLIDSDRLTSSLMAISVLFTELMGSMSIFGKIADGKKVKDITLISRALIKLAAALLILSIALKIMSTMSWEEMGVGLVSLTVGLGLMVAAVNLLPEKKVNGAAKAIKKMSSAILILAVGIKIMSTMSWEEMGVGLISMVVGLAAMVGAVNLLPKDTALRAAGMVGLATAMVILAGALKIMATMSWDDILRSLVTLAGSLLILAGAMAIMKTALPGAAAMLIIAPALVILSGALKIMSTMSWEEMAIGLVALGGSLLIISLAMLAMKTALPGAAALLIVSAALLMLAPVLKMLGSMSLEEIGKSLLMLAGVFVVFGLAALVLAPLVPTMIGLAGAITLLGVACAAIGAGVFLLGAGLAAISVAGGAAALALVTIVSSIISLIPYLIEQVGVGLILLCNVIAGSSAAICSALSVIIVAAVDAIIASVPKIVEGVLVLIEELLKSLVEHTPTIVESLFDFLIAILESVAKKLPELIQAGTDVVMAFFAGIIESLKSVDPTVLLNGIAAIGIMTALMISLAAIAVLTPAAMIGVLGLGAVITELAVVLAAIGALAQIPGLTWLVTEGGKFMQTIGTAIGQFLGGIVGGFAEGMSAALPQIGADLSAFMENAKPFIEGAKLIDSSVMDGVSALAGIVLTLTAANILDGLTSWLTGGSSLANFGSELAEFGPHMAEYAKSVEGIDSKAVVASANAAKALSEMASNLPNSGGLAGWFAGENDIGVFAEQISTFGEGLKKYSLAVAGIDADAVTNSVTAAKAVSELASNLPNSGGVVSWFTGDNDLSTFGSNLEAFGKSMNAYSGQVSGLNTTALSASTTQFKKILSLAKEASDTNFGSLRSFGEVLTEVGKSGLDGFIEAFDNSTTAISRAVRTMIYNFEIAVERKHEAIKDSGSEAMSRFEDGISSSKSSITQSLGSLLSELVKAIRKKYSRFYDAGSYLVDGFASGISQNDYKAEAKARAMAKAAAEAAQDELDINSPSKVFKAIGGSIPEGFAMGIDNLSGLVKSSSVGMANTALDNVKNSISRIADAVSGDIDYQPTIRPVLDLSDVRSGVDTMGSMLNFGSSVGVMGNIGAINSMMKTRGQNGANADVVSAIGKLGKSLGNVGNTSYNINGVNYSADSEVADAIKVIARAMKIEGRT